MVASRHIYLTILAFCPIGVEGATVLEGQRVVRKSSTVTASGAIRSMPFASHAVRREGATQLQEVPVSATNVPSSPKEMKKEKTFGTASYTVRNGVVRDASENASVKNNTIWLALKLSERAAAIGESMRDLLHGMYGHFEASLVNKKGSEGRIFDSHPDLRPGIIINASKGPNTGNYTLFNPASTRRLYAEVTGRQSSLAEEQWSHGLGARKGFHHNFQLDEMWEVVKGDDGLYNITNIASKRMLYAKHFDKSKYTPGSRSFAVAIGPSRFLGACHISSCQRRGFVTNINQTKWEITRAVEDAKIFEIRHHLTGRKLYADDVETHVGPFEWWKGFGAATDDQVQDGFMPIHLSWEEVTEWQLDRLTHGDMHVHYGDLP